MDIILLFLAKLLDKHDITLVHITDLPLALKEGRQLPNPVGPQLYLIFVKMWRHFSQ